MHSGLLGGIIVNCIFADVLKGMFHLMDSRLECKVYNIEGFNNWIDLPLPRTRQGFKAR